MNNIRILSSSYCSLSPSHRTEFPIKNSIFQDSLDESAPLILPSTPYHQSRYGTEETTYILNVPQSSVLLTSMGDRRVALWKPENLSIHSEYVNQLTTTLFSAGQYDLHQDLQDNIQIPLNFLHVLAESSDQVQCDFRSDKFDSSMYGNEFSDERVDRKESFTNHEEISIQ